MAISSTEILKKYWNYDTFRDGQEEIINAILQKKDTLALLPTGGGKSICFQVPALQNEGICIVISPLIALMKDQVMQLKKRNIKAAAIFSGLNYHEIDIILDNAVFGMYKFLYLSPERIKTELFIERFKKMNVNLIAIDEAHCISQWGYDFRKSYLEIKEIKQYHPNVNIVALTASATIDVQKDIIEKLAFKKDYKIFKKSFRKENLIFISRRENAKYPKILEIISKLNGSGIIYVRNRNKTQEIANFLIEHKISADFYHAGLKHEERNLKQDNWIKNKTQIIVCTNAFGMGIDKPDVRFVIHTDIPESLEAYYQEAGRAGRDGKNSYVVILYQQNDIKNLQEKIESNFPSIDEIKKIYHSIGNYYSLAIGAGKLRTFNFDIRDFCKIFNYEINTVINSLKILEQENYLQLSDSIYMPSRIKFIMDKLELYKFQVAHSNYDIVIKTMLRLYGGIMDFYTKIDERIIGNTLKIDTKKAIEILETLHKMKVISYFKQTDQPTITFIEERLHENNLNFDLNFINQRKKITAHQINSMIEFIENKNTCKQQYICNYFGEKTDWKCKKCDNCLAEKNALTQEENFEEIKKEILEKCTKNWTLIDTIIQNKNHFIKQKYTTIIRFLIDEKNIMLNDKNEIKNIF